MSDCKKLEITVRLKHIPDASGGSSPSPNKSLNYRPVYRYVFDLDEMSPSSVLSSTAEAAKFHAAIKQAKHDATVELSEDLGMEATYKDKAWETLSVQRVEKSQQAK